MQNSKSLILNVDIPYLPNENTFVIKLWERLGFKNLSSEHKYQSLCILKLKKCILNVNGGGVRGGGQGSCAGGSHVGCNERNRSDH